MNDNLGNAYRDSQRKLYKATDAVLAMLEQITLAGDLGDVRALAAEATEVLKEARE